MFVRVLGIDPGLSRLGYGLIEGDAREARLVSAGLLKTPPDLPVPQRLAEMAADLDRLLAEARPDAVAVERVLFQVNARTAMAVGQASGLALATAAGAGIPVVEYSPNEVKQAVAGYGAADKAQVQAMVCSLLRLDEAPKPPDVADALALALCHLAAGALRQRLGPAATPKGTTRVTALDRAIDAALAKGGSR